MLKDDSFLVHRPSANATTTGYHRMPHEIYFDKHRRVASRFEPDYRPTIRCVCVISVCSLLPQKTVLLLELLQMRSEQKIRSSSRIMIRVYSASSRVKIIGTEIEEAAPSINKIGVMMTSKEDMLSQLKSVIQHHDQNWRRTPR